jgi:hypothetical protein
MVRPFSIFQAYNWPYVNYFVNIGPAFPYTRIFKELTSLWTGPGRSMFGHLFAFRLTVDRTEMSRREEAENQGNSGLGGLRRFEPMGLPFPKWSMLQEGGFKRAAFYFASTRAAHSGDKAQ